MCNRPNVTVLCLKTVYITEWKFSSSPTFQWDRGHVSAGSTCQRVAVTCCLGWAPGGVPGRAVRAALHGAFVCVVSLLHVGLNIHDSAVHTCRGTVLGRGGVVGGGAQPAAFPAADGNIYFISEYNLNMFFALFINIYRES